ncbi:MAG: STAS domain-containing protein [Bacteroidales bacterium]|jgi:ABC-type transporter Mla MlaB component|nr:STAS domain-containing protein [Bacteroidales bacterium]
MSSSYGIEVKEEGGKRTVKFTGDLVINHADKMAAELKEKLSPASDLKVEVSDPSNIDMTFIQMVVAMRHACEGAGKKFEIATSIKDDLKQLILKGGFEKEMNI